MQQLRSYPSQAVASVGEHYDVQQRLGKRVKTRHPAITHPGLSFTHFNAYGSVHEESYLHHLMLPQMLRCEISNPL